MSAVVQMPFIARSLSPFLSYAVSEGNHQRPGEFVVMFDEQLEYGLGASPQAHQPDENREILGSAPTSFGSHTLHDFFHVTTMAVLAGRAASGMMTSSACSASRCASNTNPRWVSCVGRVSVIAQP